MDIVTPEGPAFPPDRDVQDGQIIDWPAVRAILFGALLAAGFAYFTYWQGFYRGADTAICAFSLEIQSRDTETTEEEFWADPRARPCIRLEEQWIFSKEDK